MNDADHEDLLATHLEELLLRAADEGVPIAALRRIFKGHYEAVELRGLVAVAVGTGRLAETPKEDWPPAVPRAQRQPTTPSHELRAGDREVVIQMARKLKTTKLESKILLVLLRRGHASREQLHVIVEENRGHPDKETDIKMVDVMVCKLRKKVTPRGLTISTIHAIGYEMSDADRKKAWSLIDVGEGKLI